MKVQSKMIITKIQISLETGLLFGLQSAEFQHIISTNAVKVSEAYLFSLSDIYSR